MHDASDDVPTHARNVRPRRSGARDDASQHASQSVERLADAGANGAHTSLRPSSVTVTDARSVFAAVCRAEEATRHAIQQRLVAAQGQGEQDAFDATRSARGDIQRDAYVAIYDVATATWSTSQTVEDAAGRVFVARLQVTFAPLHPDGCGKNADGQPSVTFENLTQFVLGRIARAFRNHDAAVQSVAFLLLNTLPSLAFNGPSTLPSAVHAQFRAEDMTTSLGLLSHEAVRALTASSIERVLLACNADDHAHAQRFRVDVHSRKVQRLLTADAHRSVVDAGGTFNDHPSSRAQLRPQDVAIFCALADTHAMFSPLPTSANMSEVVQFADVVEASIRDSREAMAEALRTRVADVNEAHVERVHAGMVPALFLHQQAALRLLIEQFVSGRPGCVLHLDTGLGKTCVMYAASLVLLQVNARARATWFVEAHVAEGELGLEGPKKAFASFAFALGATNDAIQDLLARITVCKTSRQGGPLEAMRRALDAAATGSDAGSDHVLFVDEASRYVGEFSDPSALVQMLKSNELRGGKVFRVAMSATPFTSDISKMFNLLTIVGAEWNAHGAVECARSIVAEYARSLEPDAPVDAPALGQFRELLRDVCVGHATMPDDVVAALSGMVRRLRIRRSVVVFASVFPDDALVQALLDAAGTNSQDTLTMLELVPRLAFGACTSAAVRERYFARVDAHEDTGRAYSSLTNALLACTENERSAGEPILVVFPSNLASVMHFVYHEVRCSVQDAASVAFIDQSTPQKMRVSLFSMFNRTVEQRTVTNATQILFVTMQTCGFGVDLPQVRTVVNVAFDWVDANQTQSMSRVGRLCAVAANHDGDSNVKFMTLLPATPNSASNFRRFFRACARGQFGAQFFPAPLHADRSPLLLRNAFAHAQLTVEQRTAYHESYGATLFRDLVGNGTPGAYVEHVYNDFIGSVNAAVESARPPCLDFLHQDTKVLVDAAADDAGAGRSRRRDDDADVGRRTRAGLHPAPDAVYRTPPETDADPRLVAAEVYCSRRYAPAPPLPDPALAQQRAAALAAEFAREFAAGPDAWATTLGAARERDTHFLKFDTTSQLRRQMVFASSWSVAGRQYIRNLTGRNSPFPPSSDDARPMDSGTQQRIAYGNRHEADAVRHVAAKYGFTLIEPEHVKAFTRIHPAHPSILAGSADAITTSGILLEIKCTRSRATFLERVANGGRGAIDNHYAQVQALLEVYDLPVALLCYWHKDEDEEGEDDAEDGANAEGEDDAEDGANADDEEDAEDGANADDAERAAPRALSYELIIPRRAGWFNRECRKMQTAIGTQKKLLGHTWDDGIM